MNVFGNGFESRHLHQTKMQNRFAFSQFLTERYKMSKQTYVYIGRFQPFHNGHYKVCKYALEKADNLVILIGSTEKARDIRNPFSFKERESLILTSLDHLLSNYLNRGIKKKITILGIEDSPYNNNKWLLDIQQAVSGIEQNDLNITLTGFKKSETGDYLNYFPQWKNDFISHENYEKNIHATEIRNLYFSSTCDYKSIDDFNLFPIPFKTKEFLFKFSIANKQEYINLKNEFNFIIKYRSQFENLKYKVPFLTADSLVVCCGHILLVERKNYPGKGLLAIPGGFVDSSLDYDQVSCGLRELREETKLKVPMPVLKGSITKTLDFSDPERSLRWRIFTKAILIMLPDTQLPKVKGGDDAKNAFWMPISKIILNKDKFFEDHYYIIQTMLSI